MIPLGTKVIYNIWKDTPERNGTIIEQRYINVLKRFDYKIESSEAPGYAVWVVEGNVTPNKQYYRNQQLEKLGII